MRKLASGMRDDDALDVTTAWRHLYTSYRRPGRTRKIKTRINRRERRDGKREVLAQLAE